MAPYDRTAAPAGPSVVRADINDPRAVPVSAEQDLKGEAAMTVQSGTADLKSLHHEPRVFWDFRSIKRY
jgi:hypothetical protein